MPDENNGNGTTARTTARCAIYTRKSTEEGLGQDFNSLDAQRDSGEAFIRSQAGEGWTLLPEQYDDGGYKVVRRWHDNRHTLVTELAEGGAGDEVIMSIAGHVSRATPACGWRRSGERASARLTRSARTRCPTKIVRACECS